MQTYFAIVEKGEDGWYAYIPDVPGFTCAADTLSALPAVAAEVFRSHIDVLLDEGHPVPAPRSLDDLRADPELQEDFAGAAVVLPVPLLPVPDRSIRTNVNLDANLLREIDSAVNRLKRRGQTMSRSGFLSEAARRMLAEIG
jgi:predicted RNase H-like HicB family nuclease